MGLTEHRAILADLRQRAEELRGLLRAQGEPAAELAPVVEGLLAQLDELDRAQDSLQQDLEALREHRDTVEAERQRYQALFEFAPDGYLVTDMHGTILEANWAAGILLNDSEDLLVGKPLAQFVAPEQQAVFEATLSRLDALDGVREWETRLQPIDYAAFDAAVAVAPDRDPLGTTVALRWLVRDITARTQAAEQIRALNTELELRVQERTAQLEAANHALETKIADQAHVEEELRRSEERFAKAFRGSPDGLVISRLADGQILEINDNAVALFGYPREAILGHTYEELNLFAYYADRQRMLSLLHIQGYLRDHELRLQSRSGEIRQVRLSAEDIEISGEPCTLTIIRDITESERAEEALRESQARLSAIIGSALDAILTVDSEQRIVLINSAAEQMFGCTAAAAIGQPLDRFIPHRFRDLHRQHVIDFGESAITSRQMGTANTLTALRSNGEEFPFEASISQTRAFGQVFFTIILRDVTGRRQAEEAIRSHARQQAVVADLGQHALTGTDNATLMQETAVLVAQTLGVECAEVLELRPDRGTLLMRAGCGWEGAGDPVYLDAGPESPEGLALQSNSPVIVDDLHTDERFRGGLPHRERGLASSLSVVIPGRTQPFGVLSVHAARPQCFTPDNANFLLAVANVLSAAVERHRAEAEIRALNSGLERRVAERTAELEAKNRELETFTYSVSHDLKAPLRGIDGYSRILEEEYSARLDEDGRAALGNIRVAVTQMNQLIDDLLAYSRLERRSIAAAPVDIRLIVNSLVAERADELRARGIRVTVDVACEAVLADVEGLSQAVRNLLDNALKFTGHSPEPAIEITGRRGPEGCVLSVRDNGIGFDMRYHDRIFGIFQRLHRAEEYPGTGIGLAIVQKAMRRMNGRVWAESALGEGACFYLEIPSQVERSSR